MASKAQKSNEKRRVIPSAVMVPDKSSLLAILDSTGMDTFHDEADRVQVRRSVAALLQRISKPWETATEHVWANPATTVALKTGIDVGLFQRWVDLNGGNSLGDSELVDLLDKDQELIMRLLRHLTSMNLVVRTSERAHTLTPFTRALADPVFANLYNYYSWSYGPGFNNLPKAFLDTGHIGEMNPLDVNWESLTRQRFFDLIARDARAPTDMGHSMKSKNATSMLLAQQYPIEILVDSAKLGTAVLVDVGGGTGADIESVRVRHPQLPYGSLVLQDTPETLSKAHVSSRVKAEAHDFFEPNPVTGARAYYLHRVLSEWSNGEAVTILKNQVMAMDKHYSKILIHETIADTLNSTAQQLPPEKPERLTSGAVAERTEQIWVELLHAAGLNIVNIWRMPNVLESIIEAEIA